MFVHDRLGGPAAAFARMDFHRNGHVSCLEFQEVISGQERYCGLKEARELFCILSRGRDGWLRLEDFQRRLSLAGQGDPCSHPEVDCGALCRGDDHGAEPSWVSSDISQHLAGHALRRLLFGGQGVGIPTSIGTVAKPPEPDDSATTAAHSMTASSAHSGCRAFTPLLRATPVPCGPPSTASSPSRWTHLEGAGLPAATNSLKGGSLFGRADNASAAFTWPDPTIASISPSPSGALGMVERDDHIRTRDVPNREPICCVPTFRELICHTSAIGSTHCTSGGGRDGEVMRQLDEGLRSLRAEVASLSFCTALVPHVKEAPAFVVAEPRSNATALLRLDEGLTSLREEVAAIDALRGIAAKHPPCSSSARGEMSASSSSALAPYAIAAPSPPSPPGGLPWALWLPEHEQGRLAACRNVQEAFDVLEETLAYLEPDVASKAGHCPSSGVIASPSLHEATPQEQASPELISASVELLKVARQRAKGFETELEERRQRHEEELAELRRRQRTQRSRSLQRMMDRLVAPVTPESANAQDHGKSRRCRRDAQARCQPLIHQQDEAEGVHASSDTMASPKGPKGFSDGSGSRAEIASGAARRPLGRRLGVGQGSLARDCPSPGPGDCRT